MPVTNSTSFLPLIHTSHPGGKILSIAEVYPETSYYFHLKRTSNTGASTTAPNKSFFPVYLEILIVQITNAASCGEVGCLDHILEKAEDCYEYSVFFKKNSIKYVLLIEFCLEFHARCSSLRGLRPQ
jgi:hypothetical protein